MTSRALLAALTAIGIACPLGPAGASTRTPEVASQGAGALEGWWTATLGTPDNRETITVHIAGDGVIGYEASFYSRILGVRNQPLGAVDVIDRDHYRIAHADVELWLSGNRLRASGFLHEPADTIDFTRGAEPPQAIPQPKTADGPPIKWTRRLGGSLYSEISVFEGVGYIGNTDGILNAISLADGERLWSFAAGRPIYGRALVNSTAVFFAADNGFLYCLDRLSGRERWRYDLGDGLSRRVPPDPFVFDYEHTAPQPLLINGTLYLGSGDGTVHAIDSTTGQRLWRVELAGRFRCTAAADAELLYIGNQSGALFALELATGKLRWRFEAPGAFSASPTLMAGLLIVGARDSMLYALQPHDGRVMWSQYWWGSWIESAAVPSAGSAFIGSGDLDRVARFDPSTGTNQWRTFVGGWVLRAPAVSDDVVYAGVSGAHRNGNFWPVQQSAVVSLDKSTGRVLWRHEFVDSPGAFLHGVVASPVIADKTLLVSGVDGTLYAFALAP